MANSSLPWYSNERWANSGWNLIDWMMYGTPTAPPSPSAPIDRDQMTNPTMWSPDIQLAVDQATWKAWGPTAIPDVNYTPVKVGAGLGVGTIALLALGGWIVYKKVLG